MKDLIELFDLAFMMGQERKDGKYWHIENFLINYFINGDINPAYKKIKDYMSEQKHSLKGNDYDKRYRKN